MDYVELLSPAGNWDCLKAAVANGADAVYFGAGSFNARRRAENFSEKEFSSVVSFCHQSGIYAYLAANTLVRNDELEQYFRLLSHAYSAEVDAVIIQHLSFIPVIKKNFPGMGIHVSTQAAVYNSFYSDLIRGADRVILPREFTLKQVREFHERTNIPVEVFVQGALCFSISGQCLMSSFLGGRSGNRGLCAQPCRKKYNGKYLLSTRDLCLLERLPEIVHAGVASLKIEGRLRGHEYVGAATAVYRRALDSPLTGKYVIDGDAYMDMRLAFNREYTGGMMFRVSDVVTPEAGGKRGVFLGILDRNGSMKLEAPLRVGDGVGIAAKGRTHGDVIREMEYKKKKTIAAERGRTVRLFLNAKAGDKIFLTSGAPRRRDISIPKREKISIFRPKAGPVDLPRNAAAFDGVRLLVKTYSLKDAYDAKSAGADRVYYNVYFQDYPRNDPSVSPYIPRCLSEWNAQKALDLVDEIKPASVLSGDPGVAVNIKGREVYLDISGNVYNDLDVGFCNGRGVIPLVSPELSFGQLAGFSDKRFAVYAHGRIPLMSTKYRLDSDALRDEKGYVFPVRAEGDFRQVLNSVPLGLYEHVLKLKERGILHYFLDLEENVPETVSAYRRILSGESIKKSKGKYTLGNYRSGVM